MEQKNVSYRLTVMACYIGNFTQAVVINLTPVLFIPLREQFGFSFSQLGLLVLINFITQVSVDLLFSGVVDRYGFRPFIVGAHILTVVGLAMFALTPILPINAYIGFVIATFIFAGAGGLLELLLSPILNAIPSDEKAAAMSVMHSFYCWGQVTVVLVTTFFLFLFGRTSWPVMALIWTIIPLVNVFLFSRVPLADTVPEHERHAVMDVMRSPLFIACLLSILFGGAAELSISQWTSTFMEAAMGIKKVVGDTLGMSAFAVMMGVGGCTMEQTAKK